MALLLGSADGAHAQFLGNYLPSDLYGFDVTEGVTVTTRLRPQYDPLTIRTGPFTIRPEASQGVGYDDNVLGTSHKQGSLLLDTRGSLQTTYASGPHTVQLGADVAHFAYPDLPTQTYTNWTAGFGWSYDIDRENTVGVGYRHFNLNQLPSGIDSVGVVQPQPYTTDTASISYRATRGPWTFVPLFSYSATRFESSDGFDLSTQNRNIELASVTTYYEFAPQRRVVLLVRGAAGQYLSGNPKPNYHDVSVLTGLDIDITGMLRFRALAGYEVRDYQNSFFSNHSAPVFEASAVWTPTGLTSVTATLVRRIEDANEAVQTGYTFTQARLVVDHEYLRNVLLQGNAWVANANYLQGDQSQTLFGVGASATYMINRNLRLTGSYDFVTSNQKLVQSTSYTRNIFLLTLKFAI